MIFSGGSDSRDSIISSPDSRRFGDSDDIIDHEVGDFASIDNVKKPETKNDSDHSEDSIHICSHNEEDISKVSKVDASSFGGLSFSRSSIIGRLSSVGISFGSTSSAGNGNNDKNNV